MDEIKGKNVNAKLFIPVNEVESSALDQVRNVCSMPGVEGVAIMPDVHAGMGATIGSVIVTKDTIAPALTGVDIGCGMSAIRTSLEGGQLREKALKKIHDGIRERIPVGFNSHNSIHKTVKSYSGWETFRSLAADVADKKDRAMHQLGTLGGGNHFIELSVDEQDRVWIMLHSGSRHIGLSIANWHVKRAKELEHNQMAKLPDKALSYFIRGTKEFDDYVNDLQWAQRYAATNRRRMMALIQGWLEHLYPSIKFDLNQGRAVFCHHNYVEFKDDLIITRKGAIAAYKGQHGIIPGAMGARSYIVEGLGNEESYNSAPHGAGRKMSRSKAKKKYTKDQLEKTMNGIVCTIDKSTIDEIKYSYKDIDKVMRYSEELATPVWELKQIINIKG